MAKNKLSIALELGGAVAPSVGAAFKTVDGHIKKLEDKGSKAKVLKGMIGDTQKLQAEWKKAHDTGAAGADKLLAKLDKNLASLRKQGVEVGRLSREYQRLGREAKAADLQLKGHQQIQQGRAGLKSSIGQAAVGVGLAAVPTTISANYQAIIRDIAIKADIVNKAEETQLTRTVIDTSKETGMSRNDVADLVNQLVGAGMELDKAMAYAPTAAKFAVGQGSSGVDTARMIMALQQNAKINDPKVMQQALEAIAFQGQAGSFEASDMAKWFPQLLASMEKNGSTGMDAVTSLGSMLQVQMKTAGSSDDAANNLKNWIEKIGSGDVVKAYADAGIDYQASLNTGIQKGMNTLEASMALAMRYVEATDPAKAKKIKDAQAGIDKEVDPEKARAALDALEKTLRTGDLFADMQVKAALTAYAQNRGLYNDLKNDSQKAAGILDKNLAERRETSQQRWDEMFQAANDSMRSVGDAIRPVTDAAAQGLTWIFQGLTRLSDGAQPVVLTLGAVAAGFMALKTASSGLKIARGVFNIARGRRLDRGLGRGEEDAPAGVELPKTGNRVVDAGLGALGKVLGVPASNDPDAGRSGEPQRVFVVNASAFGGLGSSAAGSGPAASTKRRRGRRARRQTGGAFGNPRPPVPVAKPSLPVSGAKAVTAEALGSLDAKTVGRSVRSLRVFTRGLSKLPGGKLVDAVPGVLDTALNAETKAEKAEGYGGVAGGLAGAWAGGTTGAMAGALIGSVVPVIGTAVGSAVGGAVGMVMGGLGGESVGGWLGKKLFGDEPEADRDAKPEPTVDTVPAPARPAEPATARPPVVGESVRAPAPGVQVTAPNVPAVEAKTGPVSVNPVVLGNAVQVAAPVPPEAPSVAAAPPSTLPAAAPVERSEPRRMQPGDAVRNVPPPARPPQVATERATPAAAPVAVALPSSRAPTEQTARSSMAVQQPGKVIREVAKPVPVAITQPSAPVPVPAVVATPKQPAPGAALREPVGVAGPAAAPAPTASLGSVVRDLIKAMMPAPAVPVPAKPVEPAKAEAPKVDQSFQYSPSISIKVEGDARDPDRLFGLLESRIRGSWEAWERERTARMAAKQLFDAPDVG
ncbi:phage tail tape measure protein [Pseudomonas sp. NY15372]|uniref:phage tail tape measure protein n=1 Tax=Pseudomonas sp. NY15372 TaxID=3400356 RepID=UPI003A838909